MTREEKISQAAYSQYCNSESICFNLMCDSFKQGAKWADENPNMFLLWHDITEEPLVSNTIVYLTKNNAIGTLKRVDKGRFAWYIEKYAICKWAYLEDLLPKEGCEK